MPPAPPRLSITMDWPRLADSGVASTRATAPTAPPAANGTIEPDRLRRIVFGVGGSGAEQRAEQQNGRRSHFSRLTLVTWLPAAPMRARPSATGSTATAMWNALAWIMLLRPRAMATWPFQKIRSPLCRPARLVGLPERALLHVAVARAFDAARCQRDLHETRAVEPQARLAAPEIGHAEKSLGHRDEIGLDRGERSEMAASARSRRPR